MPCFDLEKVADGVYIMRGYENRETSKYFGVANVIHHSNGLYEPCAWMVEGHPDLSFSSVYLRAACEFLWSRGWELSWRFEPHRLKAYKRMFRMAGMGLELIKTYTKQYNGQSVELCYGKITKLSQPVAAVAGRSNKRPSL